MGVLVRAMQLHSQQKQTNLQLKTRHKQLLGSLLLDIAIPKLCLKLLLAKIQIQICFRLQIKLYSLKVLHFSYDKNSFIYHKDTISIRV